METEPRASNTNNNHQGQTDVVPVLNRLIADYQLGKPRLNYIVSHRALA